MSKKKSFESFRDEYLIMECTPLDDQWECDARRDPIVITKDYSPYERKFGYEIYKIRLDGRLICIKDWEDEHLRKEN